jgi:hypothetical protein
MVVCLECIEIPLIFLLPVISYLLAAFPRVNIVGLFVVVFFVRSVAVFVVYGQLLVVAMPQVVPA